MKTGFANPSILCSHHLGAKGAGEAQGHARILEANLSFPSTASRGSIGLFGDSHSASWVELNHLGFFFVCCDFGYSEFDSVPQVHAEPLSLAHLSAGGSDIPDLSVRGPPFPATSPVPVVAFQG